MMIAFLNNTLKKCKTFKSCTYQRWNEMGKMF